MADLTQLDRIEQKLDRLLAAQDSLWEAWDTLVPVARVGLAGAAEELTALEQRGWFAVGRELLALGDRVVSSYGPDDVRALADQIVAILDTVRNATQPDVLALANEAVDVVHHADDVAPVGMFGAVAATRDAEVQRGMGVALELLKHLGRARSAASPPARRSAAPAEKAAPALSGSTASSGGKASAAPAPAGPVTWEGRQFDAAGFLLDPGTWDEALAVKMAAALGLTLSDDHWTVLRWVRQDFLATGASPNVRRVASGSGVGTRRMYELFPRTPGKTAAMLAGVPKPVGCV
jgi:TusE/DsrC/DsvC family sulfur relay protein